MNRTLRKLAVAAGIHTFLVCGAQSTTSTELRGSLTGKVVTPRGIRPAVLPVRLCSLDRVLQTPADKLGNYTFANVPPGIYDVETGGYPLVVFVVKGIRIESQNAQRVVIENDDNDGAITTACFPDANEPCLPKRFDITYRPPSPPRTSALLSGQVINWDSRLQKGRISKALVTLAKPGETTPRYTAISDAKGRFQIFPQPGIYRLTMLRKGFLDVKIPEFLIPLENETGINIKTSRNGAVVPCE